MLNRIPNEKIQAGFARRTRAFSFAILLLLRDPDPPEKGSTPSSHLVRSPGPYWPPGDVLRVHLAARWITAGRRSRRRRAPHLQLGIARVATSVFKEAAGLS